MIIDNEEIEKRQVELLNKLNLEEKLCSRGGYADKWLQLTPFRCEMQKYIDCSNDADSYVDIASKITVLKNGHVIDHHALTYFAPMEFKRLVFNKDSDNGKSLTPWNHMAIFNNQLKEHGIRLIYVPMPCKVAIYPEIAVDNSVIPADRMVIPQWRNYIKKCVENGIEIVDCYYDFLDSKQPLFSKNHHLSPCGAELIGNIVAEYIMETTELDRTDIEFEKKKSIIGSTVMYKSGNDNTTELGMEYFEANQIKVKENEELVPYSGYYKSSIGIIGDCNCQSYRGTGFDITSHISASIKYPVKYIGRYLPFANKYTVDKIPKGAMSDIKILLYVGFASGSFVRAYREDMKWGNVLLNNEAFSK